ncbi:MAG: hypothetical protein Q8P35_00320 [Candidatus Yanofskybacteria bacterium]|nr:hypothetical protein [Candidatus Yanofskybacteria bacterium]
MAISSAIVRIVDVYSLGDMGAAGCRGGGGGVGRLSKGGAVSTGFGGISGGVGELSENLKSGADDGGVGGVGIGRSGVLSEGDTGSAIVMGILSYSSAKQNYPYGILKLIIMTKFLNPGFSRPVAGLHG